MKVIESRDDLRAAGAAIGLRMLFETLVVLIASYFNCASLPSHFSREEESVEHSISRVLSDDKCGAEPPPVAHCAKSSAIPWFWDTKSQRI